MDVSLEMSVEQQVRVSPTLIAVNHVLALSSQELQVLIKQEAEENPALELIEHQTCGVCGEVMANGVCLVCMRTKAPDQSEISGEEFGFGSLGYRDEGPEGGFSGVSDSDDFDPVSLVASEPSVRERLLLDLRSSLAADDLVIAAYILGNLDDRGFLAGSTDELASELGADPEQVANVLEQVQKLGPPGIGARDPRECLLLQLD